MKLAPITLVLLFLLVAAAGAGQLPSAIVPAGLSVEIHASADDPSYFNFNDFDMIRNLGVKFVRDDIDWSMVETTMGHYDFTYYNQLQSAAAARGLGTAWILYGSPAYYGTDPTKQSWLDAYSSFCKAAASNFKGTSSIFEIWNEPDQPDTSVGTPDQYMGLVQNAVPAMRSSVGGDPNCTIVAPALSSASYTGFLTHCLNDGLLNYVDAVSLHPYRTTNPETVVSDYTTMRNLINQYTPVKPIVATEFAYSSATTDLFSAGSEKTQADYLARLMLVDLSQGIPFTNWYEWIQGQPGSNDTFGLVHYVDANVRTPTPAYYAYQLLTHSLNGEAWSSKLNDHNSNDWLLVFTGGGHTTLAAWTTGSSHTVNVSGWGTLHLTSTPFYVNPTLLPGDANLDGKVDVLDLAILAANYRKNVTGGWLQGDFNNDGVVDVQDLALLAANYRHSYASDVVPAYDGLDAAAIRALSLAGVTVVPEPSALVMLAVALIGTLAYTWTRRK